jgi:hypothetical protein
VKTSRLNCLDKLAVNNIINHLIEGGINIIPVDENHYDIEINSSIIRVKKDIFEGNYKKIPNCA